MNPVENGISRHLDIRDESFHLNYLIALYEGSKKSTRVKTSNQVDLIWESIKRQLQIFFSLRSVLLPSRLTTFSRPLPTSHMEQTLSFHSQSMKDCSIKKKNLRHNTSSSLALIPKSKETTRTRIEHFDREWRCLITNCDSVDPSEFLKRTKELSQLFVLIEDDGTESEKYEITNKEIEELSKKCDQLFKIAESKLVTLRSQALMKSSLDRLKGLSSLPKDKVINTSDGDYLRPNLTLIELYRFLEPFLVKFDYPGVSIEMNSSQIYGSRDKKVFTAVYFKKIDSLKNKVENLVGKVAFRTITDWIPSLKTSLKNNQNELYAFIKPMVEKWGYDRLEIGNVDKEFFEKSEIKSDYEIYLLLFYKAYCAQ